MLRDVQLRSLMEILTCSSDSHDWNLMCCSSPAVQLYGGVDNLQLHWSRLCLTLLWPIVAVSVNFINIMHRVTPQLLD